MSRPLQVLMAAAENDALPGAKVGGIGDVVRDAPRALAELGCRVSVVTPSYGILASLPGARRVSQLRVRFGAGYRRLTIYRVPGRRPRAGVEHLVLDGPGLGVGAPGQIYVHDPSERPFAADAEKFALFCAGVAQLIVDGVAGKLDVVHLHDWHAALVLLLARYAPRYQSISRLRTVFTIHNLALQGIRPLSGDPSSLSAWFPRLSYRPAVVTDPRWPDCINPMAVGIRLADAVHAVSPSYAREIVAPGEPGGGGGEGLGADLRRAQREGRLHGILNGCEYGDALPPAPPWPGVRRTAAHALLGWTAQEPVVASAHFVARERLGQLRSARPPFLLTTVGRLTEQKVGMLCTESDDGRTLLERLLEHLGPDERYVVLGSGDPRFERVFTQVSAGDARLIFLRGYSDSLSAALYASGDLFLMPSRFEPCGIAQMLAMRAGQPCLVHAVGGLRDTVRAGVDGFAFTGSSDEERTAGLLATLVSAREQFHRRPAQWRRLREAAQAARFEWQDSARAYMEKLYGRAAPAPGRSSSRTPATAVSRGLRVPEPAADTPGGRGESDDGEKTA